MNFEIERDERARRAEGKPEAESDEADVEQGSDHKSGQKSDRMRMTPENRKSRAPAGDVGAALKTVYQRTVNEEIPPEMLDLLGKLG